MTSAPFPKDLVVLAADSNIEFAIRGLLSRPHDLGIRPVSVDYFRHQHHDPGCCNESQEFLRPFLRSHSYALVVFDREGCGREAMPAAQIETGLEQRLAMNGWGGRGAAIAIDPELEQWVWSRSPEVDRTLGWFGREPSLRMWLLAEGMLGEGQAKPAEPKEAMEAALRLAGKARSASLYEQLGRVVPLGACTDRAFSRLRHLLTTWFA